MKRTMMKKAALMLAGALTLLAPVTAAARDRNDFRAGDRDRGRVEQRWVPNRDDHRDHDRDRARFGVYFNYAPAPRIVPVPVPVQPQGYYDQFGYWHAY